MNDLNLIEHFEHSYLVDNATFQKIEWKNTNFFLPEVKA